MRTIRWFTALAALALAACGGGSSGCNGNFAGGNCGSTGASAVASVVLVSDVGTIPSDNSLPAHMTAYVRDASNNFVKGTTVLFTASSGGLSVTQAVTDANGVATATIGTLSDPTNRTITITATADKIVATATVDVGGTAIVVQGPSSLTTGQSGTYTITLNDSAAHGVSGKTLTVTPDASLTVASTTVTTGNLGTATVVVTGAAAGTGAKLTVGGLGATGFATVDVGGNSMSFTSPAAGTQVNLNTNQTVTAHYTGPGAAGASISFSTTRGCLNPAGATCVGQPTTATIVADGSGNASVVARADNAGGATISAAVAGSASAQLAIQFISPASSAASISVQPSIFTLAPNTPPKTDQQSTISAIVRDANNNLVTGANVAFSLNDTTGGTLSVGAAQTDSQGRAQTVYTAGSTTSAANGVQVTATVQGTAIAATVNLTVAKKQVFISIGTGNGIVANGSKTQYQKDYIVQVTDSNGAGVSGVPVSMSVLSDYYFEGYRVKGTTNWIDCYTTTVAPGDQCNTGGAGPTLFPLKTWGCADEDINHNGILDPGEDTNLNGLIDAGNIALVSPASVTTDSNGFATVSVFYPEEYAYWLLVTLQAQASVQGTAYTAQSTFMLPGLDADFQISNSPPGPISPFGKNNSCDVP